MDLIVMIAVVAFFFGALALSMNGQRQSPPAAPVFVLRAEPIEKAPTSDAGLTLLVLIVMIGAAIWLL